MDEAGLRRTPSARTIARLLTTGRDALSKAETLMIATIEDSIPALVEARAAVAEAPIDGNAGRANHDPVDEQPNDPGLLSRKQRVPEIIEAPECLDDCRLIQANAVLPVSGHHPRRDLGRGDAGSRQGFSPAQGS
jgi:hypothetical protein